ncbi:MAG: FAD binding domain-containing protein [Deltaproteobacteria bacterium]|nr:FAD binding domain-containing protein [Deltaproteobacteria bacterium]
MMRLPPFRYFAPATLPEAVKVLADYGPAAMVLAGGTDLLPNMKRRQFTPQALVSVQQLKELRGIRETENGSVIISAGITLHELAAHPLIVSRYPALAQAAALISTPQIRNTGTLGGNVCLDTRCNYYNQSYSWRKALGFCLKKDGDICWVAPGSAKCLAISSSDTAPVLVSLGATFLLVRQGSERLVPAVDFFRDDGINYLNKDPEELLTEVHLPPPQGTRSTYLKLRRRGSFDFPVLGVAAVLRIEPDGVCTAAKIVLGAAACKPRVADNAADMLIGQKVTQALITLVAQEAAKLAKPLDNTDFAYGYRKRMAEVFVRQALTKLAE